MHYKMHLAVKKKKILKPRWKICSLMSSLLFYGSMRIFFIWFFWNIQPTLRGGQMNPMICFFFSGVQWFIWTAEHNIHDCMHTCLLPSTDPKHVLYPRLCAFSHTQLYYPHFRGHNFDLHSLPGHLLWPKPQIILANSHKNILWLRLLVFFSLKNRRVPTVWPCKQIYGPPM